MAGMPEQRRHSRAYLRQILDRPATLREVFTHFFAFEETLMLKLRLSNGHHFPCRYAPNSDDFVAWMEQGGPVLLGTMHFGVSDMLGVQIGSVHRRKVFIVRQRVGNSYDTQKLEARFGAHVHFLWINDPREMLFALKEAASTEHAIALQCDRPEHSSRMEPFEFLGARRLFPFTIYHLAFLFDRPVILSVGTRAPDGWSVLHASPRFDVIQGEPRPQALERARGHFQDFLTKVEGLLRENPYQWFNFLPLNPEVPPDGGRQESRSL
jgi:predicted LPLAT superfamily acyltransferase